MQGSSFVPDPSMSSTAQSRAAPQACRSHTPQTHRLNTFKSAPRRARTLTPSTSLCSSISNNLPPTSASSCDTRFCRSDLVAGDTRVCCSSAATTAMCPICNAMSNDDSPRLGANERAVIKKKSAREGLRNLLHLVASALLSNKACAQCRCPCHEATKRGNTPSLQHDCKRSRKQDACEHVQLTCRTHWRHHPHPTASAGAPCVRWQHTPSSAPNPHTSRHRRRPPAIPRLQPTNFRALP